MISFALILLVGASRLELVNEVLRVQPGERHAVELGLRQHPAMVLADVEVKAGAPPVRLALVRREDLPRMSASPERVLAATAPATASHLRYRVRVPGDYVVVVESTGGDPRASEVHLRVALDFQMQAAPEVTLLSPWRQFAVISISFAVFFAIVSYSARRLLRGIRR